MKRERYKISKLLNNSTVSEFVTKKRFVVNHLSSVQYSASKNIIFKINVNVKFILLWQCIYCCERTLTKKKKKEANFQ